MKWIGTVRSLPANLVQRGTVEGFRALALILWSEVAREHSKRDQHLRGAHLTQDFLPRLSLGFLSYPPIWYILLKLNEVNELQGSGGVSLYQECSPVIHLATNEPERVRQRDSSARAFQRFQRSVSIPVAAKREPEEYES